MVNEAMNGKSEPIGGVVGFLRFINSVVSRFTPEKIVVVWESGGASPRRKSLCPTYKAGRAKIKGLSSSIKDDLRTDTETKAKQLLLLNQILKFTPVCQVFVKNTECDDIIGYLIKYYYNDCDNLKIITSSDRDFYQLLTSDDIKIFEPSRKVLIDKDYVKEKYGVSTNNYCLARTMEGDKSDNIEGVPGLGLKTILKRFPGFAEADKDMTIEDILSESKSLLESNSKLSVIQGLLEHEDRIKLNWKLMHLDSSNLAAYQIEKVKGSLEMFVPKLDKLGLIKFLYKEQMNISFDFNDFCSNLSRSLMSS
jgi:DNA polymerase-1